MNNTSFCRVDISFALCGYKKDLRKLTADIDLPYASLLLSQHNSRLVTPLVRAERRYVTFKRERRGGDTKETFQLQLRIRCSPGRLKVSSLITSSLRRELSGT